MLLRHKKSLNKTLHQLFLRPLRALLGLNAVKRLLKAGFLKANIELLKSVLSNTEH